MLARSLRFAAAAIMLASLLTALQIHRASAQQSDEIEPLRLEARELYKAGKTAEAIEIGTRALAFAEHQSDANDMEIGLALTTLYSLYEAEGRYVEAEPLVRRALAINEKLLGPNHEIVGTTIANLASVYERQARYAEAEPLMKRALAIAETASGLEHPDVVVRLSNLAKLYETQGRYAEAVPLMKRALTIEEKARGPDDRDVGTCLNNLASLYFHQGRHEEAEPLFKRALAIAEKASGPEHPDVGVRLSNLAKLYETQGRYVEAEPLMKRALTIGEKALGPDHPDVGTYLKNLALLYFDQGRYKEAEPLLKRALAIAEKAFGPEHPNVGICLTSLGVLYREEGQFAEAERLEQRALAIAVKAFGPDHLEVGTALDNLAVLYESQARYTDAEPLLKRALEIDESVLGPDHPGVATSINNLAELYRITGRYAEAEPLYQRALKITENGLGPDHPDFGRMLSNLALLYLFQGRLADAEPLFKRALAISENALGSEHSEVGVRLNNLAGLYRAQGRFVDAEFNYKRVLEIAEKSFGPEHPDVGRALNNLSYLYINQGRYAEAEIFLKRALAIDEKAFGSDHPDFGRDIGNLAELYNVQGRYEEAESLFKRALAIDEKAFGSNHKDVAGVLNNLGVLYEKQHRYDEAEALSKRVLAVSERTLGPDHPNIGTALNNLGSMYMSHGRYAEAEPLLKRAIAIGEKALGPEHPEVGVSVNNLGELYRQLGRTPEAEPLYERALHIAEKAFGAEHPDVTRVLSNHALMCSSQGRWACAVADWQRSTSIIVRRATRGSSDGEGQTGTKKSETSQLGWQFGALVKAIYRDDESRRDIARASRETFQTAQWAQSSEAAQSLAQMAARGAKDDPKLAAVVRERQDLVGEWQRRDQLRSAAVAQAPDQRDGGAEAEIVARLAAIDARIGDIDKDLAQKFPDYASLSSPTPLSIEDVQRQLGVNEALVLFLDTAERKPTPEETFVWVVTKTDARWVRSELGTLALSRKVGALRCSLDYEAARVGKRCNNIVNASGGPGEGRDKPLPFDLANAYDLYKSLFGQVEDLIKGKQLLIVPSGPLTQLPFQVLVTALSSDVPSGDRAREVGRLGVELKDLTPEERQALKLQADRGVRIVKPVPNGPAEAVGLKPDDILLSVDEKDVTSSQAATERIRAHAPGSAVGIRVLRNGSEVALTATLDASTLHEWIPRFLGDAEGKKVNWLAREHAITVLPAVSSLKALRQYAKQSHASDPYIGFGDPLLDGDPAKYEGDAERARLARERQCGSTRVASIVVLRGVPRPILRGPDGISVADIRRQLPLPETADEVCDVARDLGVDPATHAFIGAKATEATVKRLSQEGSLTKYAIVHFATHGLVAGDLSNTSEPGVLLTPPEKPSEGDDGYLSASEVAALKLDADWVILSACNTAAGETKDAEALSGLARAFFYAGARSLLVSHWSVNSDATAKLITKAVAELKADPGIGRAEALRRSMLSMIDTGQDYEAHPAYWAPFVLVGEGAAAH